MVFCIKNKVLSHQSFIFKKRAARKKVLTDRISGLKLLFNQNTVEILATERLLSDVIENELRDEISLYKNFECLNDEKITPHFMKLVKSNSGEGNISEICNEDGTPFENQQLQKDHIFNYYKNFLQAFLEVHSLDQVISLDL